MDKIRVTGGASLQGTIPISGAKNAALPLIAATLLTREPVVLENTPHLADVETLLSLLSHFGATIDKMPQANGFGQTLTLHTPVLKNSTAPYDLVRKMRASFLVLGPLVAGLGYAKLSLPGGCAIGARPVDLHLKGLEAMGAEVSLEEGYVVVQAPKGLRGADFTFPVVSVTATENLMMAATIAKGTTRLINAAQEPEIVDLGHCLQKMGAHIEGLGSHEITIHGQSSLKGARHRVLADRIETGTYMMAVAMTRGKVTLTDSCVSLLPTLVPLLAPMGVDIRQDEKNIHIDARAAQLSCLDIATAPHPGFPTDLQAQIMALLTQAPGISTLRETIFENRFMHVPELGRMGADIQIKGNCALIKGKSLLTGAPVMATDLRASVSLVMAALVAQGTTTIQRVYHLDRGYERIEDKLKPCGALIERIKGEPNDPTFKASS